ncbi:ABC transporter ATP-binding protein [Alkalibacterium iburiense]|uniref:ABC transporter ATP-binding protein n=1 Tax=Alkalibacterium iburiense TaxID=290589 RepID=A0ABN0XR03_9LACT
MITFENVYKYYDDTAVVEDFSLTINEGEFFVLIGPSGSGKTTTLKMINQLIDLSKGSISIEGKKISDYNLQELRWNIGYVLQQIALFPNMTVEENILIVPEMKKWEKDKMHDRVTELLERVDMDPETYRDRQVSDLSGGQQQRIGVVRALAADPAIILMDEPFSALDPITKNSLQEDVTRLQKELKKTIVFVTHDMQEAINLGDRICVMNEGQIEQVGTAEEILKHPANDFVKEFLRTGLPHYKEEKTIQDVLNKDYVFEKSETSQADLDSEASLDDLTIALSKHPQVTVSSKESGSRLLLTREHLVRYYAEELETEKAGVGNG